MVLLGIVGAVIICRFTSECVTNTHEASISKIMNNANTSSGIKV